MNVMCHDYCFLRVALNNSYRNRAQYCYLVLVAFHSCLQEERPSTRISLYKKWIEIKMYDRSPVYQKKKKINFYTIFFYVWPYSDSFTMGNLVAIHAHAQSWAVSYLIWNAVV